MGQGYVKITVEGGKQKLSKWLNIAL